jgi:hypothetical protein|tara:strand:+ start:649 stop:1047 length:399 start_codon:yes stop_codon:yes gene_type:complete
LRAFQNTTLAYPVVATFAKILGNVILARVTHERLAVFAAMLFGSESFRVPVAVRFMARNAHGRIQGREDFDAILTLPEIKTDVSLTILQQRKVVIVVARVDTQAGTEAIKLAVVVSKFVVTPRHTKTAGANT